MSRPPVRPGTRPGRRCRLQYVTDDQALPCTPRKGTTRPCLSYLACGSGGGVIPNQPRQGRDGSNHGGSRRAGARGGGAGGGKQQHREQRGRAA
eukprot:scaffold100824_cov56-Phaeocystis_antarctica.AAC.3